MQRIAKAVLAHMLHACIGRSIYIESTSIQCLTICNLVHCTCLTCRCSISPGLLAAIIERFSHLVPGILRARQKWNTKGSRCTLMPNENTNSAVKNLTKSDMLKLAACKHKCHANCCPKQLHSIIPKACFALDAVTKCSTALK